ncbi:uncharacterized protein DDB_G0284459-like isoform X1 [Lytechinus pictus]|uniref:uncharacterized protein DDB_G0284459-like isoform X1 n=1 Tax=Lytechinus pictus TaxID=7653 RepID=UPI0030BA20C7
MTNTDKIRFASPSRRSVSNHGPYSTSRQDQVRSSMKSRTAGPRPLGTPASDISMYYDRLMAQSVRSERQRRSRMGQCASADLERRRNGQQSRSWIHNGLASRVADRHSFSGYSSPQLTRSQTRPDVGTRELGLTRSHTVGELRTPKINLTGVTGERPRPELTRASSWCAMPNVSSRSMSRLSSSSTSSLPIISASSSRQADALVSASCEGLVQRVSALRSLANNPRLKVRIVNGSPKISPRLNSITSGRESTTSQKRPHRESTREVVVEISKYGYHSRSNSPTYRRLINAKEQLDVALCKKLRSVRQQLDGQTARENSAMHEGLRLKIDERGSEDWYKDMVKRELENDETSEVIESMTIANSEPLATFEALDLKNPRPHVDLNFDIRYIQARINDWDVLNINVEEEEKKIEERRDKEKRRRRAPSHSPTHFRRTCEACCVDGVHGKNKQRVDFLRTNKSRRVKFRRRQKNNSDDSYDNDSDIEPPMMMDEPAITQSDILPPPSPPPPTKPVKTKKTVKKETPKSSKSTKSKTSSKAPSVAEPEEAVETEPENRLPLLPPSLPPASPRLDNRSISVSSDRESPVTTVTKPQTPPPPEEEKPKLTDKEKFLMMRKRMEERQREKSEKRENFVDYSMIAFHGTRKERAGRGQKGLGKTLSNRLESMASFKSKQSDHGDGKRESLMSMLGSDYDDDDDDDEDDDDDDDDEDNDEE